MVLATFGEEFVKLFANMDWLVVVLLAFGVVFSLVEAAIPGFGVFGILGIGCEIAGIVTHAIFSGSIAQVLILIVLILLVTLIVFMLFIHSAKRGLLAKSALVENKPSIPNDYKERAENALKPLIGKEGLTSTKCKPVGKIRIGKDVYEAQSNGQIIDRGEVIKVVAIEDARIIIDKITY